MNTHQKAFFSCAVSLGLVAAAFATPAASPVFAPVKVAEVVVLERAMIVGHRVVAPEVTLDRLVVLGHRTDSMVAARAAKPRLIA